MSIEFLLILHSILHYTRTRCDHIVGSYLRVNET